jgi:hypothetical protein
MSDYSWAYAPNGEADYLEWEGERIDPIKLLEKMAEQSSQLKALRGSNWIPICERFPDEGATVLTCYVGVYSNRVAAFWRDAGGEAHFTGTHYSGSPSGSQPVTHWMHLPEQIEAAQGGEDE